MTKTGKLKRETLKWLFYNMTSVVYYLALSYVISHLWKIYIKFESYNLLYTIFTGAAALVMFAGTLWSLFKIQGMISKYWDEYIYPPHKSPDRAYWLRNKSSVMLGKRYSEVKKGLLTDNGEINDTFLYNSFAAEFMAQFSDYFVEQKAKRYDSINVFKCRKDKQYFYLFVGMKDDVITVALSRLEADMDEDVIRNANSYSSPYLLLRKININHN